MHTRPLRKAKRRGQDTTKITSAPAELCIQSPLCLALMNLLLGVVLHSSSLVTMAIPMSHWDYLNQMRDSPVWITIRDSLLPSDMLAMRTAGPKWNHAKLYGFFAASWFFLMENGEDQKGNLSLLFPNGQVYAVIFVNDSTIMNQKYGRGTMPGSVFVHLMRNRDDLCIIVKWECAKRTQSFITRAVVFFCCTNHISSRFCLSDCSQTIYLLIELQVKGESQKLLFSDTFVAAQTFSVDELLVTRLAL